MANEDGPADEARGAVEHADEPLLARSFRPVILLAPLTLAVLVPSIVYGRYSSRAAEEAFALVEQSLIADTEGTTIDRAGFCDGADRELSDLTFHELAENLDEARSSLSNIGFGAATVDFKGWLDPPADNSGAEDSGSTTEQDVRDDITFTLTRTDSTWCIEDVTVR